MADLTDAVELVTTEAKVVDPLITFQISIARTGEVFSDVQTHDNSFAEVAEGFTAIRSELDRIFSEVKKCPYFPNSAAEGKKRIVRSEAIAEPAKLKGVE